MDIKLPLWVKALIGIVVLLLLFFFIGFKELMTTIMSFQWYFALYLIPLYLLTDLLSALTLKALLYPIKSIPVLRLFKYNILVQGLSSFVPGRMGELSLIYFFKKEGIPLGKGSALFIIDKIISIGLILSIGFFGLFPLIGVKQIAQIVGLFVFLVVVGLYFLFTQQGRDFLVKKVLRRFAARFKGFYRTFISYLSNEKKFMFLDLFFTILRWVVTCALMWVFFLSYGVTVPFVGVVLLNSIVFLITFIPITVHGFGFKESGAVVLYSALGVASSVTVSAYLTYSVFTTLYVLIMVGLLIGNPFQMKKLSPN
tara:strand:- start:501 stop:1436 length:936 start_codon:yes stop_codon:yes gene_type:complete